MTMDLPDLVFKNPAPARFPILDFKLWRRGGFWIIGIHEPTWLRFSELTLLQAWRDMQEVIRAISY